MCISTKDQRAGEYHPASFQRFNCLNTHILWNLPPLGGPNRSYDMCNANVRAYICVTHMSSSCSLHWTQYRALNWPFPVNDIPSWTWADKALHLWLRWDKSIRHTMVLCGDFPLQLLNNNQHSDALNVGLTDLVWWWKWARNASHKLCWKKFLDSNYPPVITPMMAWKKIQSWLVIHTHEMQLFVCWFLWFNLWYPFTLQLQQAKEVLGNFYLVEFFFNTPTIPHVHQILSPQLNSNFNWIVFTTIFHLHVRIFYAIHATVATNVSSVFRIQSKFKICYRCSSFAPPLHYC